MKRHKKVIPIVLFLVMLMPMQSFAVAPSPQEIILQTSNAVNSGLITSSSNQPNAPFTTDMSQLAMTSQESALNTAIKQANTSLSEKDVTTAYNMLSQLPSNDITTLLLQNLFVVVMKMPDSSFKTTSLDSLASQAVTIAQTSSYDYPLAFDLMMSLPKDNVRTNLSTQLQTIQTKIQEEYGMNFEKGDDIDWSQIPLSDFTAPSVYPTNPSDSTGSSSSGSSSSGTGSNSGSASTGLSGSNSISQSFIPGSSQDTYFEKGGQYYKTTTKYDASGKVISTTTTLATPDEIAYAKWQTGNMNYGDYNWRELGNTVLYQGAGLAYTQDGGQNYQESSSQEGQSKAPPESKLTLQYTLDKQDDSPYFIDTGIRVGLDNTITYEQAHDALYQLAVKSGGKFVEGQNRFLALMEGKVLVMEDTKQKIKITDFEKLFDGYKNVEIQALDTEIGGQYCLSDYLQIRKILNMKVDNNPIELNAEPLVIDSRVLLPVQQIAESLGAKVTTTKNEITINGNGNTIIYRVGQPDVTVNGEKHSLVVPTKINAKGVMMAEVQTMIDNLNSNMVWDTEQNVLLINKK